MVKGGLAGGWLSRSRSIRTSQLGRFADTLVGGKDSPGADGVGGVAGGPEVDGVGEGVGKGVSIGGTVSDIGATGVGAELGPQARLNAAIAERSNIRTDVLMDGFMASFIVSFSPWRPPKVGTNFGTA